MYINTTYPRRTPVLLNSSKDKIQKESDPVFTHILSGKVYFQRTKVTLQIFFFY